MIETPRGSAKDEPTARTALLPLWTLLLALSLSAAVAVASSMRLLRYDGETTPTDASIGYFSYRVSRGGPIYTRVDQPPYNQSAYGPLTYLSLAVVGRLAGAATYQSFLVAARTFVFVLFLLIATLAFGWARRSGAGRWVALTGPLLVLADPTFFPYGAGERPDIGALLFCLLGFYVISAPGELHWRRVAGAGFLMGLGFLFKQFFLAAPAAAACWLLCQKRYRLTAVLATAALLPVIGTLGALGSRGEPVLYSLLLLRHSPYSIRTEWELVALLVLACPMTLLQAGLGTTGIRELGDSNPAIARLATFYLCIAAAMDLVTMAQVGAARYYFMEPMTICSFLAPLGLRRWLRNLDGAGLESRAGAALLFAGLPAVCVFVLVGSLWAPLPHWGPLARAISGHRVLSDAPYIAAQGRDPELVEAYIPTVLERTGNWSPEPVLRQVERQDFDYVVLRTEVAPGGGLIFQQPYRGVPVFSPRILAAVLRDYRLVGSCVDRQAEVFVPTQELRGTQLARRLAAACGWR